MKLSNIRLVSIFLLAVIQFSGFADEYTGRRLSRIDFFALPEIAEPSGICIGADPEILFIISDDGTIAAVSTEGELLYARRFPSMDFEGVTFDFQTGTLLVLEEKKSTIYLVNPGTLEILSSWKIPGKINGSYEGIAWKPDGSLYLVNQVHRHYKSDAEILHIQESDGKLSLTRFNTGIRDQSGIYADPAEGLLFLISDFENRMYILDENGVVLEKIILPGESQEGIAIDAHGTIYIAQDAGGVIVYSVE